MRASGLRPISFAFFSGRDHQGRRAVVDPRRVAGRDRPVLDERGPERGQRAGGRAGLRVFVLQDLHRRPFALRHVHGNDLAIEDPGVDRVRRAPLALGGKRVLIDARDAVPRHDLFGRHAHVTAVDRAGQPFEEHRIDHLAVPHAIAPARAFEKVRRVAHRFGAAGQHHVDEPRLDRFDRMHDRLQPGAAHAVDRFRGNFDGHAGLDGRLPRDVHAGAGLEHAPHDHVADVLRVDSRSRDRLADDDRAEVGRGQILEHAPERADGRAAGTQDDSFIQENPPQVSTHRQPSSVSTAVFPTQRPRRARSAPLIARATSRCDAFGVSSNGRSG